MGRIIRRTITITETWTITWITDETPPPAATVVPAHPTLQEEPDATLPPTLSAADPGKTSAPTSRPTPDGASPAPGRQRQRPRRRRGVE